LRSDIRFRNERVRQKETGTQRGGQNVRLYIRKYSGRYLERKQNTPVVSKSPFSFVGLPKYALRTKLTSSAPRKSHWLDNARGGYAETDISDTKKALNVIVAFTAYPVFWALYEQQVNDDDDDDDDDDGIN